MEEEKTEDQIQFSNLNIDEKKALLDILGYEVDSDGIINLKDSKKQYICPFTEDVILVENASILPGSSVIINTTPLSLSEYFTRYQKDSVWE